MSLFLKHNSNASVRLSWSHSSTHLPSQSALTSLSTCSGLSKHFLLLAVALLGLPCNRKSNCYGLFLRTALSSVLMFSPTVFLPYPFFNGMSNLLFRPFGQNACKPLQAPSIVLAQLPCCSQLSLLLSVYLFCLRISLDKSSDFLPINFSIGCHFTNALHGSPPPRNTAQTL